MAELCEVGLAADDASGTSELPADLIETLSRQIAQTMYRRDPDVQAFLAKSVRETDHKEDAWCMAYEGRDGGLKILSTSTDMDGPQRKATIWLSVVIQCDLLEPLGHLWETTLRLEWQKLRRGWICQKYQCLRGSDFAHALASAPYRHRRAGSHRQDVTVKKLKE
ncbi:hypothetical protein LTR10_005364 [Elasticomyces elasticus]|nr:hypothetical protein LTR10_005364 [Elasticomyces elasticus]KAK4976101.1 hypothetical protein LTR42_003726 [Elasticomyces elasticus]